jgi:hypothetical protein
MLQINFDTMALKNLISNDGLLCILPLSEIKTFGDISTVIYRQ